MKNKIERIHELVLYLNESSYAYYVLDDPKIEDSEYDKLYDELRELENETKYILKNSPTQRVGDVVLDKFEKSVHKAKMWSLDKVTSFESLELWHNKNLKASNENNLGSPSYIVVQKFDGVSINLIYENGEFIKASTRGNGEIGENVTEQAKTIKSIPLSINDMGSFEIRGEVIMTKEEFEKYNRVANIPLKNLRNGASGALRNLDVNETKKRKLDTFIYDVAYYDEGKFSTYFEILNFLKDNKFKHPEFKLCKTLDEVKEEIKRIESLKDNLNYDIDGVVVSVNELDLRSILGYTVKHPKFSIAYKFEAEEVMTKLIGVEWNVGRSGRVSPTAILEPTDVSGITIKRATLNNIDDIVRKNVKLNCDVLIRRSNDVIPEIIKGLGREGLEEIEIPTICPSCKSPLSRDGVHLYCTNTISCRPQIVKSIVHFASRDAMNIEGFSEKLADQFYEKLCVKRISNLYEITFDDLLTLDKVKEKKANNILRSIEKSKECNLYNFIYALGIKNVGLKTSKDIVKEYKTLDRIMSVTREELDKIYGIGDVILDDIFKFLNNEGVREEIRRLIELGVKFKYEEEVEVQDNLFNGKIVVVTGTIKNLSRKDIKELLEKLGARISESVSKKTDYVIFGENAGSKLSKAKSLNLNMISEDEFNEIIEKIGI
ncbi:NAD-dependent DNA ligase [Candidatus Arthromitus sp. SFB-mouse-Japan]|uniref:NAD-dependent DNA ligase LigA n=1 Tax=Candidatus Arthromitus sp. SFB-mouse TaxID=49118 RepID=UPI00021B7F84|nr:NAD-dependent DNA ligase LigA [Candidatus Arthromitus sp. SFB-mouse]BAK56839.1 NAD-dependent DNA ligase [Candidatus Arthromitus sp. SFB-mouse-Japan]